VIALQHLIMALLVAAPEGPEPPVREEAAASPRDADTPLEVAAPEQAEGPEVAPEPAKVEVYEGPVERDGPPFYREEDLEELRARYGIEKTPPKTARKAKWRCLIADPTCGFSFEIAATAAYARRFRQGNVSDTEDVLRWNSARAQYDLWLDIPAVVETRGRFRYTRMTMGPKGGVVASDTGDVWGNVGFATRYWFGRGAWAPALEFTSALTFGVMRRQTKNLPPDEDPSYRMRRSPVGFSADIGFGLGGFGALVIGGQYESPLAREDVPEELRVSAGGTFYVGFRGNIVWGVPAAAAVTAHAMALRYGCHPDDKEDGKCP